MLSTIRPSFLDLPVRTEKPRRKGLTHVLDKCCTSARAAQLAEQVSEFVDIWKFGWGISYVDPFLAEKINLLKAAGIKPCTGGTLMEIAWQQGRSEAMLEFCHQVGFACIEVSDGATAMPLTDKRRLIGAAKAMGFEVLAEVGSKDPMKPVSVEAWLDEIEGDVQAGARWIVAEGRESGTVGLYQDTGEVRGGLFDALAGSAHADRIIYEAPRRDQQAFLLRQLGPNASLGNIDLDEVLGLETLRLGLRSDTLGIRADGDRGSNLRI